MQPIVAESVPHRGRAVALAVVLTFVTSLAAVAALPHHARGRHHHHGRYHCGHTVYLVH